MDLDLLLFTLGYLCQNLGSLVLIQRIHSKRSVDGLSEETQIFYLLGTLVRMLWVPNTRLSLYYLTYLELLISAFSSGYIVYLFFLK